MGIEKIARDESYFYRATLFDKRARDCWESILSYYLTKNPKCNIILPAYIGWSVNEGSGIFDPVNNHNCNYCFYKIGKYLDIDVDHLIHQVKTNKGNCLVLLVHYFGFPDKNYLRIVAWLKENNIDFVEDCAHALLSDFIGNACGKSGSFSFYSLHKLLPIKTGGMILINDNSLNKYDFKESNDFYPFWEYDLKNIYDKRRSNYTFLLNYLKDIKDIVLIYPDLPNNVAPQTLPVRLKGNRDYVYQEMNKLGFGMVSLYHTMIKEIDPVIYSDSYYLSKAIINFPIHQDANNDDLKEMVEIFKIVYQND